MYSDVGALMMSLGSMEIKLEHEVGLEGVDNGWHTVVNEVRIEFLEMIRIWLRRVGLRWYWWDWRHGTWRSWWVIRIFLQNQRKNDGEDNTDNQ
jgi:hypothetical protein